MDGEGRGLGTLFGDEEKRGGGAIEDLQAQDLPVLRRQGLKQVLDGPSLLRSAGVAEVNGNGQAPPGCKGFESAAESGKGGRREGRQGLVPAGEEPEVGDDRRRSGVKVALKAAVAVVNQMDP
jgi:hypothetical protein